MSGRWNEIMNTEYGDESMSDLYGTNVFVFVFHTLLSLLL